MNSLKELYSNYFTIGVACESIHDNFTNNEIGNPEKEKLLRNQHETDPHPLDFLRVNVLVQQFDEFYETYGVVEGDGMYLDPEKRIKVW